jgi:hypothetical protein
VANFWTLTPAEAAGMEAWNRGSADSIQALVAIRAAIHHLERSEDARLAIAEEK